MSYLTAVPEPRKTLHVPSPTRWFFNPRLLDSPELSIRGLGIREPMPPCLIRRPHGTTDFLLMLFHDPAVMDTVPAPQKLHTSETMMIWPAGKAQYYGNPNAPYCHTWIHCEGRRVTRLLRTAGLPILTPFPVPRPSIFQQCIVDIHHELVAYANPDSAITGNLLENALRNLARSSITTSSNSQSTRIPENLLAVRRLIASSPDRILDLREMAAMAGMSVSHFCYRFKQSFGVPPVECLIHQRMHYAAHLLGNRNLTIAEVGSMTGYEDPFQFSKIFKKHMSVSPRAYREQKS
ncbi:MAG: helix-turn-helix domain-containing protein [Candidatus Methylacidiphilales bacterium]|nr:AraC family transcriptional regulator [Candidatus Methylacidiphilales bacterium]